MGLCKCPKKKVTNQFCFEHRVNVCEHCMVTNHTKCVVQSYIQWLQDSDYNPNCLICNTELSDGDCIRLSCYHVFHWECVTKRALSLPPHTPPEQYTCPLCNLCIFPQQNAASPVAEALRNVLLSVSWARRGMGYPALEGDLLHQNSHSAHHVQFSTPRESASDTPKPTQPLLPLNSHSEGNNVRPEPYGAPYSVAYANPRSSKVYDTRESGHYRPPAAADPDDNKYQRRSALEFFARWFRSRASPSRLRRDHSSLYRRWMILLVLCLIGLATLCIFFLRWGRANADADPLLDPRFNPNIRVEEEKLRAPA